MHRSLRHKTIIRAVTGSGTAPLSVDALCRLTGASPVTVRRDLAELEAHGSLSRTHGGATRPRKRGAPMPFATRLDADLDRKRLLAQAVAELIADEESVILDNGTTCFAVAEALVGRRLTVLSLSLHAAAALASRPGVDVVVPGGPVEADSLAMVGAAAIRAVEDVRADVAVLGACSVSAQHGLTSTTYDDAAVKRACLASASRRILVAAPEKLTRTSTFRCGDVADLADLVTTADAPRAELMECRAAGVEVVLVEAPA